MNVPVQHPFPRRQSGFTLVEVTLAVGITVTVCLTLMGMIPYSMDSMHKAALISADAQVVQSITSDYQMRDWATVVAQGATNQDAYYDYHGLPTTMGALDVSFTARTQVQAAPILPGSTATNARIMAVWIQVVNGRDIKLFDTPTRVRTYRTVVAQMDQKP